MTRKKKKKTKDPEMRGIGSVYQRRRRDPNNPKKWISSPMWWVQYYHKGRQIQKSANTENRGVAVRFLKKQIELAQSGQVLTLEAERLRLSDMVKMIERDYAHNMRRSLKRAQGAIKHLTSYFGVSTKASEIKKPSIESYIDFRMDIDHASNATIKYEISILKRMFSLSKEILDKVPQYPVVRVSNVRKGFFEEAEFNIFITHFPDDLRPVLKFAYLTGWRMQSEVFTLQWSQVDFQAGEVRLDPGTTKNDEGRVFPITDLPELKQLLLDQQSRTDQIRREQLKLIPWVFHRNGHPIKTIRESWSLAIKAANIGKKIPHDFRRTAVRNLERAGVPRSVAMRLVGHKTESMYRRYAIVARNDLDDGMKRLASFRETIRGEKAKVVSINQQAGKEIENEENAAAVN